MEQYLNGQGLLTAALVLLALAWAWNLIYTAITNARKEQERSREPIKELTGKLTALSFRVTDLERGHAAHADELRDLHAGQTELCRGVQALLEHELHNGNNEEMQAASTSLGKWLRNR